MDKVAYPKGLPHAAVRTPSWQGWEGLSHPMGEGLVGVLEQSCYGRGLGRSWPHPCGAKVFWSGGTSPEMLPGVG